MESILETALTIKQDLFTNYYKITINWRTIQVLENVFYTKVSCIRRITSSNSYCFGGSDIGMKGNVLKNEN